LGSTTSPVHARRGQQGATTCGGAAAQWRVAVDTPASGKQPLGTVQALTDVTHSSTPARRMDRWVLRCLGVRARRAYDGLAWRARDVARERAMASWGGKQFADGVFKIVFLWISKLKCTLQSIAKLKITHPSTTFTMAGRGFTPKNLAGTACQLGQNLGADE
jgi:hypothetical protein